MIFIKYIDAIHMLYCVQTFDMTVVQQTLTDTFLKERKPQTIIVKQAGSSETAALKCLVEGKSVWQL